MLLINILSIDKHHNNIGSGGCVRFYFVQGAIKRTNWRGSQQDNGENK